MNDIFLSYDSSDRAIAEKFSHALEALGWSVWWDREIPHGEDFDLVIEKELNAARCAIVLWSKESVQSRWVRSEASAAAARGCLIPILIEQVELPLEFRQLQSALLIGWDGETDHPEFVRLVDSLRRFIERAPKPIPSPSRTAAPGSRRALTMAVATVAVIAAAILAFALRGGPTTTSSAPPSSAPSPEPTPASVDNSDALQVAIGETIEEGVPGPGAGVIETAHEKDAYELDASRGQTVYFRVLSYDPALASVEWQLVDSNDTEIFSRCLGCSQPGVQQLRSGGRYRLVVGSDLNPGVGSYRLRLHDVPAPDRFTIAIGGAVGENATGPGAGTIESPGVEDVYSFEAAPRQRVYFRILEFSSGIAQARMRLLDEDETVVFDTCMGCSEPGVHTLTKGGVYTMIVGNRTDPGTGTYRLQLFDVPPPDDFAIGAGARISNGVPGPGAGRIESPGAEDRYALDVEAGRTLELELADYDKTLTYNEWRLLAPDGAELFRRCFGCSAVEPQTFSRAGRYQLIVGNPREASTGDYSIEITSK